VLRTNKNRYTLRRLVFMFVSRVGFLLTGAVRLCLIYQTRSALVVRLCFLMNVVN
jgi:hypothetical protein